MAVAATEEAKRDFPPLLHVPVDASCRLIPVEDLLDRDRLLAWIRVHGLFVVIHDGVKYEIRDDFHAGTLANDQWRGYVVKRLETELEQATKIRSRPGAKKLAEILFDCPPLLFLPQVLRLLFSALEEREAQFFEHLAALCRSLQTKAKRAASGRLRPPWFDAWGSVQIYRQAHPECPPEEVFRRIAEERHPGERKEIDAEVDRLRNNYKGAKAQKVVKVVAVAFAECPLREGASLHVGKSSGITPELELPGPRLQRFHQAILDSRPDMVAAGDVAAILGADASG